METYTTHKGIDLSHQDGNPDVNLHEALNSGINFCFIKATQGTWTDPKFVNRQPRVRETFPVRGFYCFVDSTTGAVEQGNYFAETIGKLETNEYAVFDLEDGGMVLTGSEAVTYVMNMVAAFKAKSGSIDNQIIIYTSIAWAIGQFGEGLSQFTNWHLWAARYNSELGSVAPWSAALVWQNSEHGTVPGIGTDTVDLDLWLDGHWPIV